MDKKKRVTESFEMAVKRVDFIIEHMMSIIGEAKKHPSERGYVQLWVKPDFTPNRISWIKADMRTLKHFHPFDGEQPPNGWTIFFELMWEDNFTTNRLYQTLLTGEVRKHASGLYELFQSDGKTGMFSGLPFE